MALDIPVGFGQVLIPLKHANQARPAAITFGVEDLAARFYTPEVVDGIQAAFTGNVSLDENVTIGPSILRINTGQSEPITVEGSTVGQGATAFTSLPPNCAVLVRKSTLRGGRRGRGRMYVPWLGNEASVDENGRLDSTFRDFLQTAFDGFLTGLEAAQWSMVVLHNMDGVTPAGDPSEVTTLTVDPVIATQRRRLRS